MGDGAEHRKTRISVLRGEGLENMRSGREQGFWVDVVELGGELELLTDRWLGDIQRVGDLALAHASGRHGPKREDAT